MAHASGIYTEQELLSEHAYAKPHFVGSVRCHGGFDAQGDYIPPRTLGRAEALADWTSRLEARGGRPLGADASLLAGVRVPTPEQQRLLLERGLGQTFWNMLTITGKIEARGRVLRDLRLPDFQEIVIDDLSGCALGHLNRGLLRAHGLDEGGDPERGIGGHDAMWFALRDLCFGADAFPDVDPPERIGRPEGPRVLPELPAPFEGSLIMLLNLLIVEFRAENGFALSEQILMDPALFVDRRERAEEAAAVVRRIRADECIHVDLLRLYLGEFRSASVRTVDGRTVSGASLLDPVWEGMVHWATVEQPRLVAAQQREIMTKRILEAPDGAEVLEEFNALAEWSASAAQAQPVA